MEIQESFQIFDDAIKTKATRKFYTFYLNKFLAHTKARDYDSLIKFGSSELEKKVIDYVRYLKRKNEAGIISPNGFRGRLAPIELFFDQNDIDINWKKIKRMYPRTEKKKGDLPYTLKDLKALMKNTSKPRNKAVIAFFTSSGVRPEALIGLEMRHVKEISDNCASVLIYEHDTEEYQIFLTPEAWNYLKEYFKQRETNGEKLTANSPIFRNDFAETIAWQNVKPMTTNGLYMMMKPILEKTKVRGNLQQGKARYSKASFTGFRKWYETTLDNILDINPNVVEKLMGHRKDLRGVYYNPNLETRFNEFKKAISALTISDVERQKIRIEKQEKELTELEELKRRLTATEAQIERMKIVHEI